MFIIFPNVSGAMFIQGGTFIPDSRVDCQYHKKWLDLPKQLKTHIAFSMFPILGTNLC